MSRRLLIFISSTSDLIPYRDAAEQALKELRIDESRFENWPSTPMAPVEECLRRVSESDAVILILGGKYRTILEDGLSPTHHEYLHAVEHKLPVFAWDSFARKNEIRVLRTN
jgi:hypothetical protein